MQFSPVKKVLQVCGGGCSGTTHNQPGAWRSGVVVPGARTVLHCTALYCTAPYTSHCQTLSPRREVAGVTLHLHFHASVREFVTDGSF